MTIKIIEEKEIHLTQEQYDHLQNEYTNTFRYYSGNPPTFEVWVRRKLRMNEDRQLLQG